MKKIELSTENARKMYGKDRVMDELLLANFTKEELTEPKLPDSWEEYCQSKGKFSNIEQCVTKDFLIKQQAERQLYLLMKEYNGDWVADWEGGEQGKYTISRKGNSISVLSFYNLFNFLAFPTEELRDKFLNNFRDLIEIYFEL